MQNVDALLGLQELIEHADVALKGIALGPILPRLEARDILADGIKTERAEPADHGQDERGAADEWSPDPANVAGVTSCLNSAYYDTNSETANSTMIGSWGKHTQVAPPRDVDILYLLPDAVYWRFQERTDNIQSQLLQEVKGVLEAKYFQTRMRADGQVIVVQFNSTAVEVAPGFRFTDGTIRVCDTKEGGRYINSTAEAEAANLNYSDAQWKGNTRAAIRMAKAWQRSCNVPLKSFQIERLCVEFMAQWTFHENGIFYYDWMMRDFFAYAITRANTYILMPGYLGEAVALGNEWLSRAESTYGRAVRACEYEHDNYGLMAGEEWQKIFGTAIPMNVE